MAVPREQNWTAWNGGGVPVTGCTIVEVRFRYGDAVVRAEAGALCWSHDLYNAYGADDIVAYHVIGAAADAGSAIADQMTPKPTPAPSVNEA